MLCLASPPDLYLGAQDLRLPETAVGEGHAGSRLYEILAGQQARSWEGQNGHRILLEVSWRQQEYRNAMQEARAEGGSIIFLNK